MKKLSFETISIELTKRCNLDCRFCYSILPERPAVEELSTEQVCSFLERFRTEGGRRVLFTGGEIFLRADIRELILYAKSHGLLVDLFSNGTLLTEDDASFIAEHVNLINISLDGPEEHHDRMRGKQGSFNQARQAILNLQRHKAHFGIQCMITPENLPHMEWLVELSKDITPLMIKLGHVSKMGRGDGERELWFGEEQISFIKSQAAYLAEECNHFHTRVTTNIITNMEMKVFYPSFMYVITPWMLPDGRILTCYVHGSKDFWTLSTAEKYPLPMEGALDRRNLLVEKTYERAAGLPYFDLLEITSVTAEEIAVEEKGGKTL